MAAVRLEGAERDRVDARSVVEGLPTAAEIAEASAKLEEPSKNQTLVVHDGSVVGYSTIRWWQERDDTWLYLHRGYLLPEHRGQAATGAGKSLEHAPPCRIAVGEEKLVEIRIQVLQVLRALVEVLLHRLRRTNQVLVVDLKLDPDTVELQDGFSRDVRGLGCLSIRDGVEVRIGSRVLGRRPGSGSRVSPRDQQVHCWRDKGARWQPRPEPNLIKDTCVLLAVLSEDRGSHAGHYGR